MHISVGAGEGEPELRVYALGSPRIYRGNLLLTAANWGYAKPKELLFYLLCRPSAAKAEFGSEFWPEAPLEQLHDRFHAALRRLRQALGRPDWVLFEHDHYHFNRSLNYWFDVEQFQSGLVRAKQLLAEQSEQVRDEAATSLETTLRLYHDDFPQGLSYHSWVVPVREQLRQDYLQGLLTLGRHRFDQRDYREAIRVYQQAIAGASDTESAHRELMRCYARRGEYGRALRYYQSFAEQMQQEHNASPSPETMTLFERLRRGEEV